MSLLHKNILIICFLILNYLGKSPTWLGVKRLLTVTCVASIIKLLMCFIWIRCFFRFGKSQSPLCSFCDTEAETTLHVFHKCLVTKILWKLFFEKDLDFPQAALFGFINNKLDNNLNILQNHILLIFKLYIYQLRERGVLHLNGLIKNATKVKKLERKIASAWEKKTIQFNNKWKSTKMI